MMRTVLILSLLGLAAAARATPHLDPGKPPASAQQAAQAEIRTRAASVGATLDADAERLLRGQGRRAGVEVRRGAGQRGRGPQGHEQHGGTHQGAPVAAA